jgi:hippurate hydrolase
MLDGIERINQAIWSANDLPPDLKPTMTMKGFAKVLSNDAEMARVAQPVLTALLGERGVMANPPKLMGSEDFHHLVLGNDKRRYLYMYVGSAKPEHFAKAQAQGKLVPYSNHNPDYQVDLDAIPLGTKVGAVTVLEFFARGAAGG